MRRGRFIFSMMPSALLRRCIRATAVHKLPACTCPPLPQYLNLLLVFLHFNTHSIRAGTRQSSHVCCSAGSHCHKIASAVAIWLSDRRCSQAGSMGTAILLVLDVSEYISFEKGAFLCRILMEYLNSQWGWV